jgi:protein-disulfide isomerase
MNRVLHLSRKRAAALASWPARAILALAAIAVLAGCADLDDAEAGRRTAGAPPSVLEQQRAQGQGVDLRDVGYNLGDPEAPIAIVEFSDFGCQYCGSFARESFPALRQEFIATGKVQWKYVPYVLGIFPNGDRAAIAGECAAEQGESAFWAMHDRLYENQREWKSEGDGARALFARYAAELQLDRSRFLACYDANRPAARIVRNTRLGQQLGVRATPTFFINGARLEGALPLELFRQVLQEVGGR